jgi:hypothetical protein
MLHHLFCHLGVDLEEGWRGDVKVFAEDLDGERVAACNDDGMFIVDVDDGDIRFDLEFGSLFGFGFEDEHEFFIVTRAKGDAFEVHA